MPTPERQIKEMIESQLLADLQYSEDLESQDRLTKTILLWEDLEATQVLVTEAVAEIAAVVEVDSGVGTVNVDLVVSVGVIAIVMPVVSVVVIAIVMPVVSEEVVEVIVVASPEVVIVTVKQEVSEAAAEAAKAVETSEASEQMHQGNELNLSFIDFPLLTINVYEP